MTVQLTSAVAAPVAVQRAPQVSLGRWVWSGGILTVLAFLVLYPLTTLLLGALTNANPVVEGIHARDLSLTNFIAVLVNPNVHAALINSLVVCGAGTVVAVVVGLTFSWVVVRTDTPCKRLIATASMLPLFVPPLVAAVAWSILGSPRTRPINTMLAGFGMEWRRNISFTGGLLVRLWHCFTPPLGA